MREYPALIHRPVVKRLVKIIKKKEVKISISSYENFMKI